VLAAASQVIADAIVQTLPLKSRAITVLVSKYYRRASM
jgi:hypothetical protein